MKKFIVRFFLAAIIIIPYIVNAETVTVKEEPKYYNGEGEALVQWTDSSGKEHDSLMTSITLSDNKTAYCIDPGVAAPGKGATCTKTILSDEKAAINLAIFNGGESSSNITAYALRYANYERDDMTTNGRNGNIIDAYSNAKTDGAKAAKDLADKAINSTKNNNKNQNKKAVEPIITKKGNTVTYSNVPKGTLVTMDGELCPFCTTSRGTSFTIDDGSGSFTIQIDETLYGEQIMTDPDLCANGEANYSLSIVGTGQLPDSGTTPKTTTPPTTQEQCIRVAEYSCGDGNDEYQRFIACDEMGTVQVGDQSDETPSEVSVDKPITGKLKCDDVCQDVGECPDESQFIHFPDEAGSGNSDELCDSTGLNVEKEIITEAKDLENNDKAIWCCILGSKKHKAEFSGSDFGDGQESYCGNREVYCTEDYTFNSGANIPFGIHFEDRDSITSGSYFRLGGGPLEDEARYICYTRNSISGLLTKVKWAAQGAVSDYVKTKTVCSPGSRPCTYYSCNSYTDPETGQPLGGGGNYDCPGCCTYGVSSSTPTLCPDWSNQHYYEQDYCLVPTVSSDLTITWSWNPCGTHDDRYNLSSCNSGQVWYTGSIGDIKSAVDTEISNYEDYCYHGLETTISNKTNSCERDIVFDYYDGSYLGITPKNFTKNEIGGDIKAQTNQNCVTSGSNIVCTESDSTPNSRFDLGTIPDSGENLGASKNFKILNRSQAEVTKKNQYNIEGIGICNNYTTGERSYGNNCNASNATSNNGTTYTIGWPVSYDTGHGAYEYRISVQNVDSCLNPGEGKFGTSNIKYDVNCLYEVNGCKGCEFKCPIGGNCTAGDCNYICQSRCRAVDCLYDAGVGLTINYQPISLITLNSAFAMINSSYSGVILLGNLRNLESTDSVKKVANNSGIDPSKSRNWNNEKGYATLEIINNHGNGEDIYAHEPQYKVTLKPSDIKTIQDYNILEGGYFNDTLDCKKQGDPNDKYVVCESSFLWEFLREHNIKVDTSFDDDNKFVSARAIPDHDIEIKEKSGTGPAWR